MCVNALFAVRPAHLLAMAFPAFDLTSQRENAAISGPAMTTETRARNDALLLLVKREILHAKTERAKRQHKRHSHYTTEIKRITHQLMRLEHG